MYTQYDGTPRVKICSGCTSSPSYNLMRLAKVANASAKWLWALEVYVKVTYLNLGISWLIYRWYGISLGSRACHSPLVCDTNSRESPKTSSSWAPNSKAVCRTTMHDSYCHIFCEIKTEIDSNKSLLSFWWDQNCTDSTSDGIGCSVKVEFPSTETVFIHCHYIFVWELCIRIR